MAENIIFWTISYKKYVIFSKYFLVLEWFFNLSYFCSATSNNWVLRHLRKWNIAISINQCRQLYALKHRRMGSLMSTNWKIHQSPWKSPHPWLGTSVDRYRGEHPLFNAYMPMSSAFFSRLFQYVVYFLSSRTEMRIRVERVERSVISTSIDQRSLSPSWRFTQDKLQTSVYSTRAVTSRGSL